MDVLAFIFSYFALMPGSLSYFANEEDSIKFRNMHFFLVSDFEKACKKFILGSVKTYQSHIYGV